MTSTNGRPPPSPKRNLAVLTVVLSTACLVAACDGSGTGNPLRQPNVLVIIADDLGIGDVGCFGNDTIKTPGIDRLCREGARLTHHLAVASTCTPSRAGLLTARYPQRFGLTGAAGAPPVIFHVASRVNLPSSEPSIGRAFAAAGYRTHYTGKWHLGSGCAPFGRGCDSVQTHGFNSTFWMPFSLHDPCLGPHSFWRLPADAASAAACLMIAVTLLAVLVSLFWLRLTCTAVAMSVVLVAFSMVSWFVLSHYSLTAHWAPAVSDWMVYNFDCLILNGTSVRHRILQLETLNDDMVNSTVTFLESQAGSDRPFLAVHAFGHTHTPIVSAPHNRGRSQHGRYGDNVEEMDDGVVALLAALDNLSLTNSTIVYFVSDHGGVLESVGEDGQRLGGHNGLFKGGKSQGGMEGGIRVPGVVRYPGVVDPGTDISVPTSLLDIMPTLLELAGLATVSQLLPNASQPIDGVSFSGLLTGAVSPGSPEDPSVGRVLLHHAGRYVSAVRYITGPHIYKMYLLRPLFTEGSYQCGWGGLAALCTTWLGPGHNRNLTDNPLLYDLATDPYEDRPLANSTQEYVDTVGYLKNYLKDWHERVPYPPSLLSNKYDVHLLPWLQPF